MKFVQESGVIMFAKQLWFNLVELEAKMNVVHFPFNIVLGDCHAGFSEFIWYKMCTLLDGLLFCLCVQM